MVPAGLVSPGEKCGFLACSDINRFGTHEAASRTRPPSCICNIVCLAHNFDTGPNRSFISALGYSTLPAVIASGRSRSHAHLASSSGAKVPSSIWSTYLPITGKNLKPWNDPQVATYSPLAAACGEMMKSDVVVNASLFQRQPTTRLDDVCASAYQQIRCFVIGQS